MMKRVLLLAACTAALVVSAHATIDFCVVVRNTPDGFLALREGPGTRFRMKARLKPGELLIADTRRCMGENEPICDEKGEWKFINYVPRLDDGKKEHFTQGWVATKFTTQARCPGEAATAQSKKFPSDLVGTWCLLNEGTFAWLEISSSEFTEGEGGCDLRRLKIDKLNGNFELTMSCNGGVEGEKSQIRTQLFSTFQMEGRRHMLRFGSMYDPKSLSLYKLETPTDRCTY